MSGADFAPVDAEIGVYHLQPHSLSVRIQEARRFISDDLLQAHPGYRRLLIRQRRRLCRQRGQLRLLDIAERRTALRHWPMEMLRGMAESGLTIATPKLVLVALTGPAAARWIVERHRP